MSLLTLLIPNYSHCLLLKLKWTFHLSSSSNHTGLQLHRSNLILLTLQVQFKLHLVV